MNPSTAVGGGTHFTLGYVGHGGDPSQPITMVQCSGTGEEEGWDAALLRVLLQAQGVHQEGLLSAANNRGGTGVWQVLPISR